MKRNVQMGKIYVVGIGPGAVDMMTIQARRALEESDVIAGYRAYTELVKGSFPDKEYYENGMGGELERCEKCLLLAEEGKCVALVCSGDAGVYGMASPLLELAEKKGYEDIEVIPGVTAALSGAAVLGAPFGGDFCTISLSDLMTPWEVIEKRLRSAAEGDFCMAIYNPSSRGRADHLRRACNILMEKLSPETPCGYVRNIGREGCESKVCTLSELAEEKTDMFVTVFIGNSQTREIFGKLVTPRGYKL